MDTKENPRNPRNPGKPRNPEKPGNPRKPRKPEKPGKPENLGNKTSFVIRDYLLSFAILGISIIYIILNKIMRPIINPDKS